MFDYTYDTETGGLLLNDGTPQSSKEPRPVFSEEMRILHMDDMWEFDFQNNIPYMWAESANYYYRGELVARTVGGSLYEAPIIEYNVSKDSNSNKCPTLPRGTRILPIDVAKMVNRNTDMMSVIEQSTCKKIYAYYKRNKNKLDCFHVAFSGGKDSVVLLELVYKALRNNFIVVFGDTKMEFPDTYALVDIVEKQCKERKIPFYRAASHFDPADSWRLFGPPSNVLRWCCTVHKAAPQTLKIREVLGKADYVGADFVGVRAAESLKRSEYEFEGHGKKQKGQYSQNPILDWTSAEIWMYIFSRNLPINATYKKGNSRAGCLFCPMGGGKADSFRMMSYPEGIEFYTNIIQDTVNDKNIDSYITNGGWINRKNGRDLLDNSPRYEEEELDGKVLLKVSNPSTDWKEWIKTLGEIPFKYTVETTKDGYTVSFPSEINKTTVGKHFKQVFRKSAHCVECRVCEMNCPNGCISFKDGLRIDNCIHCRQCHAIDDGCLVYHSVQQPKNGGHVMKSLNSFADHAPKASWIVDFFDSGNDFLLDNTLGPMQISMFKRFLSDAKLINKNKTTDFFELTKKIGAASEPSWGLIYIQLAYENPQIRWYIENLPIDETWSKDSLEDRLMAGDVSAKDARSITKAFKRLCETPLGTTMNLGFTTGKSIDSLTRTKCSMKDDRVLLYALYRYAEACEDYYEFSLTRLMDVSVESAGLSPVKLFGYSEDEMETMLNGLSSKYPEYINASFTHGLDKISLRDDRTADDVLKLF
jgi:phosphoadenosine phosphosulfate reductase